LNSESLSGPVNPVSPNPMRYIDFARAASQALGQKPGGAMPATLVRLTMGEMGEEFILASRRIQPAKLLESGYTFRYPELEGALRHEMGKVQA
jgi:NAD dependent epimerase/dehydratase family enzyme